MLISYHNSLALKTAILAQIQSHHDADQIVQGRYWEGGKGCAVGCTIHGSDHGKYETAFGIPRVLAHLEDCIFEALPNDGAKKWPMRFMAAIPVGADLSMIWPKWCLWMLLQLPVEKNKETASAVSGVTKLYEAWVRTRARPTEGWAAAAAAEAGRWAEAAAAAAAAAGRWAAEAGRWAEAGRAAAAAEAGRWAAEAGRNKFWLDASNQLIALLENSPLVGEGAPK